MIQHLLTGGGHNPNTVNLTHAANTSLLLSHLDSSMFVPPDHSLNPRMPISESMSSASTPCLQADAFQVPGLPSKVHLLDEYSHLNMRPQSPPEPNPNRHQDRFHPLIGKPASEAFGSEVDALFKAARAAPTPIASPVQPGDGVLITTLGTGSSVPSMYRNRMSPLFDALQRTHNAAQSWAISSRFLAQAISSLTVPRTRSGSLCDDSVKLRSPTFCVKREPCSSRTTMVTTTSESHVFCPSADL